MAARTGGPPSRPAVLEAPQDIGSVRVPCGWDEEWSLTAGAGLALWQWFEHYLRRAGVATAPASGRVAAPGDLPVAQAERLAVHLLEEALGEVRAVVPCAESACGALLEVPVDPRRLPPSEPAASPVRAGGGTAPSGLLLVRDLVAVETEGAPPSSLPSVASSVEEVETVCPRCGTRTAFRLHPLLALREALTGAGAELGDDVHVLASAYHWRHADIMDMPTRMRRACASHVVSADGWDGAPTPAALELEDEVVGA